MRKLAFYIALLAIGSMLLPMLPGCDWVGELTEADPPYSTSETDPNHIMWGGDRSVCHLGIHSEVLSSIGPIRDRRSVDGIVVVDPSSDVTPTFDVDVLGYKPCAGASRWTSWVWFRP